MSPKKERQPNLGTILMIENFLKKQSAPISVPQIKKGLPKQVMHQTLKIILQYLWDSKKIEYTPDGIKYIFEAKK